MKDSTVIKIPSHPKYLRIIRALTDEMTGLYGMEEREIKSIRLAVDEACSNVIKHAYNGDTSRKITIRFNLSPKAFEVIIEDDGIKVKPEHIKGRDFDDVRPGGLGTHFIKRAFDVVLFDEKKNGNRLKLSKYNTDKKQDTELKRTKS